ncbi:MAG: calcium-binding EGF-like domain-containing protein, partial [Myxococcales bacterium]|nr:calcium-binding EGF-like domain-containing protein [Myxococcales bacterium]
QLESAYLRVVFDAVPADATLVVSVASLDAADVAVPRLAGDTTGAAVFEGLGFGEELGRVVVPAGSAGDDVVVPIAAASALSLLETAGEQLVVALTVLEDTDGTYVNALDGSGMELVLQGAPVDPCVPNPCANDGICSVGGRGATVCDCTGTGFEGPTCEDLPVDPCAATPCANDGACVAQTDGGFACDCSAAGGFGGPTCADAVTVTPVATSAVGTVQGADTAGAVALGTFIAGRNSDVAGTSPYDYRFRAFAVLDVPVVSGTIVGARVVFPFDTVAGVETLSAWSVETDAATVATARSAGDATGLALYDDLADGTELGRLPYVETPDWDPQMLTVALNAAGVAEVVAHVGGSVVIGFDVPTDVDGYTLVRVYDGAGIELALEVAPASDPCDPSPCAHGVCYGDGACNCDGTGFEGPTCAQPVDPCAGTPCDHGGLCVAQADGGVACDCTGTGFGGPACADDVTETPVGTSAVGFYSGADGAGESYLGNFIAGRNSDLTGSSPYDYRSRAFVVVDVPAPTGTIVGARLVFPFDTVSGFGQTLIAWDVTADAAAVATARTAGDTEGIAIYADLGSGAEYGRVTYDEIDGGDAQELTLALNAAGVAAVAANAGGSVVIGFDVPTDSDGYTLVRLLGGAGIALVLEEAASTGDPCAPSPCAHGTCYGDGLCDCAGTGYEGTTCADEVNECLGVVCQNDGTCVDELNGFHCACPAGFTGTLCEADADPCDPDPCVRGVCTNPRGGEGAACVAREASLLGWWPGDEDGREVVGDRTAALVGDAHVGAGLVSGAFVFDGAGDELQVTA